VGGHAHLSPADASQSSVDTHIRKGERRISMPKLPQCGNFMEPVEQMAQHKIMDIL
jgi:hypothetical protein